ncbi:TPA: bacteriocin class II family protein [Streptococcus suis]
MNTKSMEQFNVLNTDSLATVEGGVSTRCVATIAGGAFWGGSRGLAGGLLADGYWYSSRGSGWCNYCL